MSDRFLAGIVVAVAMAFGGYTVTKLDKLADSVTDLKVSMASVQATTQNIQASINTLTNATTLNTQQLRSVRELIQQLHPSPRDRAIIRRHTNELARDSFPYGLPIQANPDELAVETSHLDGAVAISVLNAKRGDYADVIASRGGTVVSVVKADEPVRFSKPHGEQRAFYTIEIEHQDSTRMMYSRLTEKDVMKGQLVKTGELLGRSQAFSPICLRVCLKLPGTNACLDPSPLMPTMTIVSAKVRSEIDKRPD